MSVENVGGAQGGERERERGQKSQTAEGRGTDEKIIVSPFLWKDHSPPSSKGEDESLRKSLLLCCELLVLYHIPSSGE
jgi:hypothetical protein